MGLLTEAAKWTAPSEADPVADLRAMFKAWEDAPPPRPHMHAVVGLREGARTCIECGAPIWVEGGKCRAMTADEIATLRN